MDAYEYPVTYVLRHKFKTTLGKITQERAKFQSLLARNTSDAPMQFHSAFSCDILQ